MAIDWGDSTKRKAFREALQEAYPRGADLELFVDEELGENLAAVAGGTNLQATAYELVKWAKAKGRLDEVYQAFKRHNPRHPVIARLEPRAFPQPSNLTDQEGDRSITSASPNPLPADIAPPNLAPAVFVSYAWGGESETIVNQLDQVFQQRGITLIRDKRDLGFKGRIKDFMQQIGRGKAVVVVISEKYLKSENCMFELVQIAENGAFYDRIFPIVLNDANIYKPVQRLRYVKYWEDQIAELDEAIKSVGAANLQGIRDDIDSYTKIRATIAELTNILKDMNTLTPDMHTESGFKDIFEAIATKLAG